MNFHKLIQLCLSVAIGLSAANISAANNPIDSICKVIPTLSGNEKLQAYANMCRVATASSDSALELGCIHQLIAEAKRQNNAQFGGDARAMLVNTYYNYDMEDSLKANLPAVLDFMSSNKQWDLYYNSWNVMVEQYIYTNKLQSALNESQKMYDDAKHRNISYGIGVACYERGSIYQTMSRYAEAEAALDESIKYLKKQDDITYLLNAYNVMSEVLDAAHKFEAIKPLTKDWRAVIDDYKQKAERKGYMVDLSGRYLYCTLASAIAAFETKDFASAEALLGKAEKLAAGRKVIAQYKLLQVKARYYKACGKFEEAIACNDKNLQLLAQVGDDVSRLSVLEQQAELYEKVGRDTDALKIYKELMPARERLRDEELTSQLDEMQTIYNVDTLKLQNQVTRTRMLIAVACVVFLLIMVVLAIVYVRRLRAKNEALYDVIGQLEQSKDSLVSISERLPEESLSREELIYRNLCKLMHDEHLFLEQIGRDDLARKLGTNSTYVVNAIKECGGGITVSEFINSYRVRYAGSLLVDKPELSINEVCDMSGYTSRATFSRQFKDYYSMSPTEYRELSKSKKL